MIQKNQPTGIRNIVIIGLDVLLCLVWMIAADRISAAPVAVTVGGTTTCNNGAIERTVAGTMTTTCGAGWSVGSLPPTVPVSASPLHFSDLISGPSTGLGDGLGSGVIVTVWGQNLGSTQGSSKIQFIDANGTARTPHVYYWKNADGALPGGPSNLYESHNMQEIAFSIPAGSSAGLGTIRTTVAGEVGELPFTVRSGNIYHVKSNGNDTTGDGSFNNPWLTIDKAHNSTASGDTLYVHDVVTGSPTTDKAIYNNFLALSSAETAQYSYIAYPNTRPEAIGHRGFVNWLSVGAVEGLVQSKFSVYAAEADTDANDLPINARANVSVGILGSANGRTVGNYVTDEHPSDSDGACPDAEQGAISGNADGRDQVSNWKVYGNHVEDYGCSGTTKQHHTTYFSVRSGEANLQLASPEVAYNYLKNNKATGGIHFFDENKTGTVCGNFNTVFKVHNNVIVNQVGAAISNYSKCPTNTVFDYYNNLAINSGVYPPNNALLTSETNKLNVFEAVAIGQSSGAGASTSIINFYNNTFINWNVDDQPSVNDSCIGFFAPEGTITINWNDNICQTDKDKPFIQSNYLGTALESRISGSGNVWYTSAGTQTNAVAPTWDATKIITDPLLTVTGSQVSVGTGSPIINQSSTTLDYDVYGAVRGTTSNVGAAQ